MPSMAAAAVKKDGNIMNDALAAEQVVAYLKDLAENVCERFLT